MRGMWAIARKDVRQRLRDGSAYVIGIVVPLVLAVMIGMLADQADDIHTFAFTDEDGGIVAAGFAEALDELEAAGVAGIEPVTRAHAVQMVDDDEVAAAFVVPAGFSDAATAGAPAELTVIANRKNEIGTQQAAAIAAAFATEVDAVGVSVATVLVVDGRPMSEALILRAAETAPTTGLVRVAEEGAGVDLATHISFGMVVFFLFFTVQFAVLGLIGERSSGTMARLVAAPIRPGAILGGKALAAVFVAGGSVAVLVVATSAAPLETDWGNLAGVGVLTLAGVLAAIGVAAVIGALARTSSEAMGYMTFAAVLLGLLGGAFGPMSGAGAWLDRLSKLTPQRWLIDGFRANSVGESIADLLPAIGVILAFAAVTLAVGLVRFRKQVRSP